MEPARGRCRGWTTGHILRDGLCDEPLRRFVAVPSGAAIAEEGPNGSIVLMNQIGHEEASRRVNRRSIQSIWRSQ